MAPALAPSPDTDMIHPLGDPHIVPADYPENKPEFRDEYAARRIVWVEPRRVDAHIGDGYAFVEVYDPETRSRRRFHAPDDRVLMRKTRGYDRES